MIVIVVVAVVVKCTFSQGTGTSDSSDVSVASKQALQEELTREEEVLEDLR